LAGSTSGECDSEDRPEGPEGQGVKGPARREEARQAESPRRRAWWNTYANTTGTETAVMIAVTAFGREDHKAYRELKLAGRELPDAELIRLDTGHFAVEDCLDEIAGAIRRFHEERVAPPMIAR